MELKNKLQKIIDENKWYPINSANYNSAGLLLEKLLGLKNNDLPIPDYNGYELKTKFDDSTSDTTLLHAAPDSYLYEIKRLYDTYGYPSIVDQNNKVFLSKFYCTRITTLGSNVCGKLFVDYVNQRVVLKIYNFKTGELDDKVAWSFDMLRERIELKLRNLCYVFAKRRYYENNLYCKYYKFMMYHFKGFDSFLRSLEYGHISIKFTINVFKSGKKKGQMHDHGTCFDIGYENLCDIYDIDEAA